MMSVRLQGERSAAVHVAAKSNRFVATLGALVLLGVASNAGALQITGSGTSVPGGGSCSISPAIPSTGTGAVATCTGINLGAHTKVYLGINNVGVVSHNGLTMTGTAPASGSAAIYRSSSTTASSITYTSTTTVTSHANFGFGTDTVSNTLTLSRSAGTGGPIATGGTPANNGSGDIGHLFQVTSASFTLDIDATSTHPDFGSGQSCGRYDAAHPSFGNGGCISGVSIKFYWSDCGDGVIDSPEVCDDGISNGSAGSCCTTSCTFKAAGTACTDSSPTNCKEAQCVGTSNTCDQNFGNEANGTPCSGNGTGDCSAADTCSGGGTCLNNDLAAGTPCPDGSPPSSGNCKDAQCNGSGACDQNFGDESSGTPCVDGAFCNGTDQCNGSGTCSLHSGDPCPGPNGDSDCSESCNEAADDCTANDLDGSSCLSNGTGECTAADTCLTGICQDNDIAASTPCGDPSDTDCSNPDTCDGSGSCDPNNELATVVCRPATTGGDCDEVELCDGAGNCPTDGVKPVNTECRPDAGECDVADVCDGSSHFCPTDGFEPANTPCGDPTNTDCDNPDTCDGNNNCLDNLEANGFACGDPSNTDCTDPDTCDGAGTCEDNHATAGTSCGNSNDTQCTDPDTCDGAGACEANHAADTTPCDDGNACTTPDECNTGTCVGTSSTCPLDHYKCYQGKDLKNPSFTKLFGVNTDDQIITNDQVDIKKLKYVCSPVDKNGEGINDPSAHLACYLIKATKLAPRPSVQVSTQFQLSQFQLKKGKLLCLPATKTVLP